MVKSLQGKILLVYLAPAVLAISLCLLALLELGLITGKVQTGSQVADFFDATLEMRRFEKNHFLYGQPQDLAENARFHALALELLRRNARAFVELAGVAVTSDLEQHLSRYQTLMADAAQRLDDEIFAASVRGLGNRIVTAGELLASRERQSLREALAAHQRNLLLSVAVVTLLLALAGRWLTHWVTHPLKEMETRMEAIAQGQMTRLALARPDRELASLVLAFNRVMDELERRQRRLLRSEKLASLGTLLSGVAHELNNPLSNISSSAQILVEDGSLDEDFRRQLQQDIDQESRRAAKIVRSLLDYARDRDFQRVPVNLAELLDETQRFLKTLKPAGVDIVLAIPPDLQLMADRSRLQQAFLNLIKNALEAIGDFGELRIEARRASNTGPIPDFLPAPGCRPGIAAVDILFADTGPGMTAEVMSRMFDPFFTTKPVGHGNGLGLFIVHEIIEEHGGCIGVIRQEAATCFQVRLPVDATSG